MDAAVRLEHSLLAVDGEHDVHAMVEIVAPDQERADENRLGDAHDVLLDAVTDLRAAGASADADALEQLAGEMAVEYTPLQRKHFHYESWQSRHGRRLRKEQS